MFFSFSPHSFKSMCPFQKGVQLSSSVPNIFFFCISTLNLTRANTAGLSLTPISYMISIRHAGVNESCCQPRVESDSLDRTDGRGWWTEQLWHTSLSEGSIHLIINAFQLVANKRGAGGQERKKMKQTWKPMRTNVCLHTHISMPTRVPYARMRECAQRHTKHIHASSRRLTYNSELCIGVDLSVLIPGHTLVHSCVRQSQATDWQHSVANLYALLWTHRETHAFNMSYSHCSST